MGSLKQNRGHEEGRTQVKSCGKSKVASVNALEPRAAMLETLMSAAQDILDSSEVRVDGLEGEYGEFTIATKALIQDQMDSLQGDFRAFHDELLKLRTCMQSKLQAIRTEFDEVRPNWA